MATFFFYGTLMDPDVRAAVLGTFTESESVSPAVLTGWKRVGLRARSYPVLVKSSNASVEGVQVSFAPGAERAVTDLLTSFEGTEYRLETLMLSSGDTACVFVGSRRCHPTGRAWLFSDWERRHKRAFLFGIR